MLESAGLIETRIAAQSRLRRLKPGAIGEVQAALDVLATVWSKRFDWLDSYLHAEGDCQKEPRDG